MASDSGSNHHALWIALIGLLTTVSGGLFANWDRMFPPPEDPAIVEAADPAPADAPDEPASAPEPGEAAASEPQ